MVFNLHHLWWIIPLALIGFFLILNLFILIIKAFQKKRGYQYDAEPWDRWMFFIQDKDVKIRDLVLPGSHDSGSTKLYFDDPKLTDDKDEFGSARPALWLVGGLIQDYSVTQDLNLYDQAVNGMRMFDLRINLGEDGQWYLWHGFRCIPWLEALKQLDKFAAEHPSEIFVLWCRIEPKTTTSDKLSWDQTWNFCSFRMVNHEELSFVNTYSEVLAAGKQWFVFANSGMPEFDSHRYKSLGYKKGEWFNENDVTPTLANLQKELITMPNKDTTEDSYVMQYIVTPDAGDFVAGFFARVFVAAAAPSLRTMAHELNDTITKFVETGNNKQLIKQKCAGIWGDFFEQSPLRTYIKEWNNVSFP